MYSKIAINNVKKSFKDYTIYFLTLTFAVCIFYSFNSISSQKAILEMNNSTGDTVGELNSILTVISIFVSVILGGLIVYANNFLIKKRKKELGIYMTLGMAKSKISKIILFETIAIGIISLGLGLLLGIVMSQGLSLFIVKLFEAPMEQYGFIMSLSAIGKTLLYFGIIFLLVVIFNVKVISKYELIDMLNAQRKNENNKVKNKAVAIFIFVIAVLFLSGAYGIVNKIGLRPDRNIFWIAVLLGILGTLLWFFSLSTFLILMAQKSEKIYFKGLNIFVLRQLNSKINTNFISMTVICLMLFLTIGILSTGLSFKNALDIRNEKLSPFDVSAISYRNERNPETMEQLLKDIDFKFKDSEKHVFFNTYDVSSDLIKKIGDESDDNELHTRILMSFDKMIPAIKISDFNNILKLQGKEPIKLNEGEVIIKLENYKNKSEIEEFINKNNQFILDNKTYHLSKEIYVDAIMTGEIGNGYITLIIPDNINAEVTANNLNVNFEGDNKQKSAERFNKLFDDIESGKVKVNTFIHGITKARMYQTNNETSAVIVFIGIYIGIIFLISSAAVLALQQLSEASDSKDRYEALRKIGATEKMINKTIFIQTLIYYGLPLVLALIHSVVGIAAVSEFITQFAKINIMASSLLTAIIFIIIYGGYFYVTYIGYKNMVKKK